jgi:hypothetical protein
MTDGTLYAVAHAEESKTRYGYGSSIPTFGAATSVLDQYRTVGVVESQLAQLGAAFTDVAAVAAISKIAEGGIESVDDLARAELACQALLLHDVVHVVVHAPKVDFGKGLVSYARGDEGKRTQHGFDLFAQAGSRDLLVAPEMLTVDAGVVATSTFAHSPLIGMTVDQIRSGPDYWSDYVGDALNAALNQHGIPAYLTDKRLVRTRRGDGFAKRFYDTLNVSWEKATANVVPIVCTFNIPPMLAIVLHRLNNRADLNIVIRDLRAELAPVRRELVVLNEIVSRPKSQLEISRQVKYITDSFAAIIPEASLSGAEKVQRKFAVVQGLVRPIVKFMGGFFMKTGPSMEDLMGIARNAPDLVIESRAVVDRTVTARTFVELVKVEAIQTLVGHHFTTAEIQAIENSLSQTRT